MKTVGKSTLLNVGSVASDSTVEMNTKVTSPACVTTALSKDVPMNKILKIPGDRHTMNVNLKILENLCTLSEIKLRDHLKSTSPSLKDYETYLYADTGSRVLAVAHMDVLIGVSNPFRLFKDGDYTVVMHPNLDDRLGIFTILHLFPQYGIATDVLLTTDEEICRSTARDFTERCKKNYNWIVEVDRAGEDVVLYNYESDKRIVKDLKSVGFNINRGSYSDICEMEGLFTSAFNMGIGYHFQHTTQCCASLQQLARQLKKLQSFYNTFKDVSYEHEYVPIVFGGYPRELDFDDDSYLYDGWGVSEDDTCDMADTYWVNGQMHWAYVPPRGRRKRDRGYNKNGRRLWSGHWNDENNEDDDYNR